MAGFIAARDEGHLPSWKKHFWEEVEKVQSGLSVGIGVYSFLLQHGKNVKPWYVGKTSAKGGFKAEVFQNHKAEHYSSLASRRGAAKMLFLPLVTESGKISKNTTGGKAAIERVERRLISFALARNNELLNSKDTRMESVVFVPGIIGTRRKGAPAPDAKLNRAIFLGEK